MKKIGKKFRTRAYSISDPAVAAIEQLAQTLGVSNSRALDIIVRVSTDSNIYDPAAMFMDYVAIISKEERIDA